MKRSVEVSIDGKAIALRTDADQSYLDALASFVEERYNEVRPSRGSNPHRQAILAALNIADELFKERSQNEELKAGVRERCERIKDLIKQIDPVGKRKR